MPKKGKKIENLGKNIQKFENILKKGRWLRAILARNKLLEKALRSVLLSQYAAQSFPAPIHKISKSTYTMNWNFPPKANINKRWQPRFNSCKCKCNKRPHIKTYAQCTSKVQAKMKPPTEKWPPPPINWTIQPLSKIWFP